jgi:cob(I)alamin adenosyltransferase
LKFQDTIFGEHAVESLKLHETNFLKLQEIANELEARLMFVDSQISQDWQFPHRKKINELMYSFGDTLCHVRKVQKRINFLKYPAPSPSSVVSQVNAPVEERKEEVLNKQLTGLRNDLWKIDGDLYVDHGETNLNLQEERLSQLKKTLRELEESLGTLDSQTSTDLQSKEREFVNTLLGSLSTSQCLFREVEKRLNHLKSPSLRSPVIHLSSGSTVLTPGALTTDEIEGSPSSSLATKDPLAQDLQETEEELSQLGLGLGAIDGDLYDNHTENNLRFQEEKLSLLKKNLLQELEERLSSLDSKISKDLSSPQRERLNSLLGSFSNKQCDIRDLEKRIKHLQSARLLALDEEILGLERMFRAFGQEERHIDGELFGNHSMENLSLQETNLQLLEKKVQKMESRLMELGSEITKESSPQQREKLDELTHSVKEKLCLHAVQSRIETLKKLALSK